MADEKNQGSADPSKKPTQPGQTDEERRREEQRRNEQSGNTNQPGSPTERPNQDKERKSA